MIAWRIVSCLISKNRTLEETNETPFYTNPEKFCEIINKYFTEFCEEDKNEDGFIYDYYDMSNFTPDELMRTFGEPWACLITLFKKVYYDRDEHTYVVKIETAEVVV